MLLYGHCKFRRIVGVRFFFRRLRERCLPSVLDFSSLPKFNSYPKSLLSYHGNDVYLKSQNQIRTTRLFRTSANSLCIDPGSQQDDAQSDAETEMITVIFITPEGEEVKVRAKVGENVLNLAKKHDVGAEGACEGKLACTTCHMYVDKYFEQFIEGASEQEEDLLDTAPFLKENSRLTCQITLTKEMDGVRFVLPQATINFYVDGHKPVPH